MLITDQWSDMEYHLLTASSETSSLNGRSKKTKGEDGGGEGDDGGGDDGGGRQPPGKGGWHPQASSEALN